MRIVKKILQALPLDPAPTIDQMIEACTKLTSLEVTIAQAVSKGWWKHWQFQIRYRERSQDASVVEALNIWLKIVLNQKILRFQTCPPRLSHLQTPPLETFGKQTVKRGTAPREDTKHRAVSLHHASSLKDGPQNCKQTETHQVLVSELSFLFEDNTPHMITVGQIGFLDKTTDIPIRGDPVHGPPELFYLS